MEVLIQATELFERIKVQIKDTENIEEQSCEETKATIQNLKCDLLKDQKIVNEIIEAIQRGGLNWEGKELLIEEIRNLQRKVAGNERQIIRLEWEIHEKDKWIKELKTDVQEFKHQLTAMQHSLLETKSELTETREDCARKQNDLTNIQNDFLEMKGALQTGQLVYNFEKDLAKYIYPPGQKIGSQKIFTTMKEWLEEMKGTDKGDKANKKWNDLKREFSWSRAHENLCFKLVKSRLIVAHPSVHLGLVRSHMDERFTDEENKCIEDIINMTDRVNDLMKAEKR